MSDWAIAGEYLYLRLIKGPRWVPGAEFEFQRMHFAGGPRTGMVRARGWWSRYHAVVPADSAKKAPGGSIKGAELAFERGFDGNPAGMVRAPG
jgi:hypothetical protein